MEGGLAKQVTFLQIPVELNDFADDITDVHIGTDIK